VFAEIYERYHGAVYTYVFYRVGDQALAEDLTADVFVRAIESAHRLVDRGRPLLAWLYTIARNRVIDHYRRNGSTAVLPLEERLSADKDHTHSATCAADLALTQRALIAALRHLTEAQRQVILLKFVEGRSNAEVAALLGKREGAIKSLQHRALAALRRTLESSGFDDEP